MEELLLSVLERQGTHEYFLHDRWRGNQVFQFKVEDPLETLSAQSPELRELPQKPRQIVGSQRVGAAARDVVLEAGDELILQILNTPGLLQAVSICRGNKSTCHSDDSFTSLHFGFYHGMVTTRPTHPNIKRSFLTLSTSYVK